MLWLSLCFDFSVVLIIWLVALFCAFAFVLCCLRFACCCGFVFVWILLRLIFCFLLIASFYVDVCFLLALLLRFWRLVLLAVLSCAHLKLTRVLNGIIKPGQKHARIATSKSTKHDLQNPSTTRCYRKKGAKGTKLKTPTDKNHARLATPEPGQVIQQIKAPKYPRGMTRLGYLGCSRRVPSALDR